MEPTKFQPAGDLGGGDNGGTVLRDRPLRVLLLIDYRFIESTSAYSSSMLSAVFTFPRSFAESG